MAQSNLIVTAATTNTILTTGVVLISVFTLVALAVFLSAAFYSQHHLSPAEMKDLGLHHLLPQGS